MWGRCISVSGKIPLCSAERKHSLAVSWLIAAKPRIPIKTLLLKLKCFGQTVIALLWSCLFLTLAPTTGSGLWPNFLLSWRREPLSAKPCTADCQVASWPHDPCEDGQHFEFETRVTDQEAMLLSVLKVNTWQRKSMKKMLGIFTHNPNNLPWLDYFVYSQFPHSFCQMTFHSQRYWSLCSILVSKSVLGIQSFLNLK